MPHGLDHLHRNHGVVVSLDVAIIAQIDAHPIGFTGSGDSLAGHPSLAIRGGDGADDGAARIHNSPHPVPTSSSRVPGPTPAASSSRSILRRCAWARSGQDAGKRSNNALEYVMVSSRNSMNRSLDTSS